MCLVCIVIVYVVCVGGMLVVSVSVAGLVTLAAMTQPSLAPEAKHSLLQYVTGKYLHPPNCKVHFFLLYNHPRWNYGNAVNPSTSVSTRLEEYSSETDYQCVIFYQDKYMYKNFQATLFYYQIGSYKPKIYSMNHSVC